MAEIYNSIIPCIGEFLPCNVFILALENEFSVIIMFIKFYYATVSYEQLLLLTVTYNCDFTE